MRALTKISVAAACALVSVAGAHQVDLGSVPVQGECPVQRRPGLQPFESNAPQWSSRVGRAQVTAVMQPAPEARDPRMMEQCAQVSRDLVAGARLDSGLEQRVQAAINACLAQHAAPYRIQWLVIRRGSVEC